ncbi:Hypothetical protein, putative [Bodo saltans]|uniref:Ribosomal protein L30 ferredoxin-like fold domain-containing protein n=1 Tax=Bodo saltans TaxID=75058 RepID=A0A0S4JNJ1_BODSA|nr:Hypothetical protein, putative [Bodo saltans]|eukprot:CUG91712.1 Hypothetical protein, putative [Bodo saltans]
MLRRLCPISSVLATTSGAIRACAGSSAPAAAAFVVPQPPLLHVAPTPHRTVGGVFIVLCQDHPFKHQWEVIKCLRDLRLEFRGQVTIHPDIPQVRKLLWRTRHVVKIERLDLDEAKDMIGVPKHMRFSDLATQIPSTFGRMKGTKSPGLRSKMNFMQYRRMRIRDVLHRDAVEKKLLAAKKNLRKASVESSS